MIVVAAVGAGGAGQPRASSVAVPGGSLALDEAGSGAPVVFLHGGFFDRRTWNPQMLALAASCRADRYDIRPFGESSAVETPYRPTDDLLQVLDAPSIDRAHLVGHSFGGGVALDFALAHPDRLASLVLAGVAPGLRGAADALAARIPSPRLEVVAGADHALPMGWADAFNERVPEFLRPLR